MTLDPRSSALAVVPAGACHEHQVEADRQVLPIRPVSRLETDQLPWLCPALIRWSIRRVSSWRAQRFARRCDERFMINPLTVLDFYSSPPAVVEHRRPCPRKVNEWLTPPFPSLRALMASCELTLGRAASACGKRSRRLARASSRGRSRELNAGGPFGEELCSIEPRSGVRALLRVAVTIPQSAPMTRAAYEDLMKLGRLAAALLAPSSAVAQVATVDQMTCAQARTFVQQHGRVYAKSPDGPLPVFPIASVWTTPYCPSPWLVWPQQYVTRDGVHCTVGYMCQSSGRGD